MHNISIEYKQMHNKTISWNDNWILIFICFVGRLLLDPSASSSSSFVTSSFLIQMLKMDKRFFKNWVLHIPYHLRNLLWWWELDLKLLPSSLLLLWVELLLILLQVVLWFERPLTVWSLHSGPSHPSNVLSKSYSDLCSSLQIAWSRNQTYLSVSLGKTLVVQVDPWLN